MSLYPELDGLNATEMQARFDGPPVDGADSAATYYTEIAEQLGVLGELTFLWDRVGGGDEPHLRALVFALSRHEKDSARVRRWLVGLLAERRGAVLADVIDGLARVHEREVDDNVLRHGQDPSEYVRGAVLRYARNAVPERAFALLSAAAADPHFIVRENVADELAALRDPRGRAVLEGLKTDAHPHVRQAATSALAELDDT